jgi:N-acetylglucosamine-6-phosphate deacetylase
MIGEGEYSRDVATGEWISIRLSGDRIGGVARRPPDFTSSDPETWVAPAFWDIQTNGRWGWSLSDPTLTVEQTSAIVLAQAELGTARLCPTLITAPYEAMRHGVATIAAACDRDRTVARMVLGIHLEGPAISEVDGYRGAHPRGDVRGPSWEEFERLQEESGQRIVLVTLAPERPGAIEFIEKAVESGVTVALGHTAADPATIEAAVSAGATLSTHLGNGIASPLPRHPNPIWSQAGDDRLYASLIADGHHLDPSVLRVLIRAKGPERCVLVSDASPLAGLPVGRYGEWAIDPSGKVVVAGTPYLAGSNRDLSFAINMVLSALPEIEPRRALEMASLNPATLLGCPSPRIAEGVPANLIRFRLDERGFTLLGTTVDGRWTPRGEGLPPCA